MRPTRDLRRLRTPVVRRMRRVWGLINAQSRLSHSHRDSRKLAYAVIELQNIWIEFVKNFFLSCALRARLPSGGQVAHGRAGVITADDALAEAVYLLNPRIRRGSRWKRHQEPNWIQTHTIVELAKHFSFSNQHDIYAAFSYEPSVLQSLPELRNFFAHKNFGTYQIAMKLAARLGIAARNPTELTVARAPSRPQTLVQDWIDDLIFIVEFLCA
jgi:hypothetical protein